VCPGGVGGLLPCVSPGADDGVLVLGAVGGGAGVEVGTAAGEVATAPADVGCGVDAAFVGFVRTAGELLTARTAGDVGPAPVCWLPGWAAGCCVGSRTGRVTPGMGTPLSRLMSTTTMVATRAAAAVRMVIRSARDRVPVASANTVSFLVWWPN
jgi:hypothetical protein